MDALILLVFAAVYSGMILGRFPGLALDRTGVAILGAIALLATGRIHIDDAWHAIDVSTIALLLGLMVVSAQFRLGGFYTAVTLWIAGLRLSPLGFLAWVIAAAGALSALLANDIVCLAMTPLLIESCLRRGLKPLPFCLALACASNVGSAATLIGNPQNMLIGQTLSLSFNGYLLDGVVPAVLGLSVVWAVVAFQFRGNWSQTPRQVDVTHQGFDAWQTGKGLAVLAVLVVCFVAAPWPREIAALAAAGVLLCSRRMHSRQMLGLIDWHLLLLFAGLFVVNQTLESSGGLAWIMDGLARVGVDFGQPLHLFAGIAVLSNLVSNVPATMLLLPAAQSAMDGAILALASTLAGNLILVGSIANLIVADQAARMGEQITWTNHARTGIPVTLATLAIAAIWLYLRYGL